MLSAQPVEPKPEMPSANLKVSITFVYFLPLIIGQFAFLLYRGLEFSWVSSVSFVSGIFFWTFLEYALHRWPLHYRYKNPKVDEFMSFHRYHHQHPKEAKQIATPPTVGYMMYPVIMGVSILLWMDWTNGILMGTGVLVGYLIYEWLHYSFHHKEFRSRLMKALQAHHMRHHYKDPRKSFGVSTILWDRVFRTNDPVA